MPLLIQSWHNHATAVMNMLVLHVFKKSLQESLTEVQLSHAWLSNLTGIISGDDSEQSCCLNEIPTIRPQIHKAYIVDFCLKPGFLW